MSVIHFLHSERYHLLDYDIYRNVLEVSTVSTNIAYALICASAPTAGAILSGFVSKAVGGYDHPNATKLGLFISLLSLLVGFPLPWINSFPIFCIFIWFYLFAGGLMLPLFTGVMLSAVEPEFRPQANSLANVFYTGLGWVPAPIIWGWI